MKRVLITFCLSFLALTAWANETALTVKNVQGDYVLKSGDGSVDAKLELATKLARLQYTEEGVSVRCRGDYTFDDKNQILDAKLYDCGVNKLSLNYITYLSGQTLESLKTSTHALVSITDNDEKVKTLPFSVKKIK